MAFHGKTGLLRICFRRAETEFGAVPPPDALDQSEATSGSPTLLLPLFLPLVMQLLHYSPSLGHAYYL